MNARCYQVQISVDGASWSNIAHYWEKADAEHDAQASLFTYRRINKNAKTRVVAHVENISQEEFDSLRREGVRIEKA